jgi:hypothetical protein
MMSKQTLKLSLSIVAVVMATAMGGVVVVAVQQGAKAPLAEIPGTP